MLFITLPPFLVLSLCNEIEPRQHGYLYTFNKSRFIRLESRTSIFLTNAAQMLEADGDT